MQQAGSAIRNIYAAFERWRGISNSISRARTLLSTVQKSRNHRVAGRKTVCRIKEYCGARFGDERYWPWLALYTELRGQFLEGWLPDVLYTEQFLPRYNPKDIAWLSTRKSFDYKIFRSFSIQPLAVVVDGVCFDIRSRPLSRHQMEKIIVDYGKDIVIKMDGAGSGEGITFLKSSEISRFRFRKDAGYVIQPSVDQHPVMAEMHPQSVNTVRITTFLNHRNKVDVKHRSLRFGVSENRVVNKSGLFLFLSKDGQVVSDAFDGIGLPHGKKHPDTGYRYQSLKVPSIQRAEQLCRDAHLLFPYLRFIAWDLFIDPYEHPRLIEWNAVCPDMWVNEALIGPLWSRDEMDEVLASRNKS